MDTEQGPDKGGALQSASLGVRNPNSSSNSLLIVWMPLASLLPSLGFSFHIYRIRMVNSKALRAPRDVAESCIDMRKNRSSGEGALAKHVQTA